MLTFTVYGVAQPKGSMRAFVPAGMKHPIITDSNRNAKAWAQLVAEGASRALGQQRDPRILDYADPRNGDVLLAVAEEVSAAPARRAHDGARFGTSWSGQF